MNIVISGYGKMGRMIEGILQQKQISYITTEDVKSVDRSIARSSVCIDFTTPEAIRENYKFLAESFSAVVIGTTGWNDIKNDVIEYFDQQNTTLIYASNFAIGVNIFFRLAEITSAFTASLSDYDPYLIELHHNQKLDAPSGTAKSIADIVTKQTGKSFEISSVRAGVIPGIHELGFESEIDRITLKHEAFSRKGFAEGAVEAAIWSENLKGVFDFKTLLDDKFNKIINNIYNNQ